jgi:DNA polymerase-1
MRVVIDIEANGLKPTKIWCIVCKDIDTGEYHIFREGDYANKFVEFSKKVTTWIGHNILDYDLAAIKSILLLDLPGERIDTLIVSKLVDYSRKGGHSLEQYGEEFGLAKGNFNDWSKWSQEMEEYCVRDVDITHKVYLRYLDIINDRKWAKAISLEHRFQLIVSDLHDHGFAFNTVKATNLLKKIEGELHAVDAKILTDFPGRLRPIKEITPRLTKYGTLNKSDFRWVRDGDLSQYSEGATFTRCVYVPFNPSSHKQIIDILREANWSPTEKTKTYIQKERDAARGEVDEKALEHLKIYGWKINETNLQTLPPKAPAPARTLAQRILLESRRRTLVEWLALVQPDGRIHGEFYAIGAWTHRMAHQKPNTANIPNEFAINGSVKLYGKELRQLWQAPKNRLLVGVDAEGIQLRVFAHYIDDKEFTEALVKGTKNDRTDPHSLNQRILGSACKSRSAAKRFIFALLLGAGVGKLGEILECSKEAAQDALDRLMERYQGFTELKKSIIPADAKRGWFLGLDGRQVVIPDETVGGRRHLAMSGYLQNGEAVIIKTAAVKFYPELKKLDSFLVDIIHDEYQTETPNNMAIALQVAEIKAKAIAYAGEHLKLKCPLSGSYWDEDHHKDYTIGKNWWQTH